LFETEQKLWNEYKEFVNSYMTQHKAQREKEVNMLKNTITLTQKEMDGSRKLNESLIKEAKKSMESQLALFKDREMFTVNQLLEMENRYSILKEEKERTLALLKEEMQEIKNHNSILSKMQKA
jgi:hypothetical protein